MSGSDPSGPDAHRVGLSIQRGFSRAAAMLLVLCRDPLEPTRPDRAFEAEIAAVEGLGMPHVLVDHDALVRDDDPGRAVRRVLEQDQTVLAAYRGWMMMPRQYERLYEAL